MQWWVSLVSATMKSTTCGSAVKAETVLFLPVVSWQIKAHAGKGAVELVQAPVGGPCLHSNIESASQSGTKILLLLSVLQPFEARFILLDFNASLTPPAIACKMRCRKAVMPASSLRIIRRKSLPGCVMPGRSPPPAPGQHAAHNIPLPEQGRSCQARSLLKNAYHVLGRIGREVRQSTGWHVCLLSSHLKRQRSQQPQANHWNLNYL